jgi:hypothetical protein
MTLGLQNTADSREMSPAHGGATAGAGRGLPNTADSREMLPAHGERGQSTVEVVAMLPLLVAVALAIAQVLAAGAAREFAGHAAEAGAVALLEGGDPEKAAREAVPGWSRSRLQVEVKGESVHVTVRPQGIVPPLARAMETTSVARTGT